MSAMSLKLNFQQSVSDEIIDLTDHLFITLKWIFFFLSPLKVFVIKAFELIIDCLFKSTQK